MIRWRSKRVSRYHHNHIIFTGRYNSTTAVTVPPSTITKQITEPESLVRTLCVQRQLDKALTLFYAQERFHNSYLFIYSQTYTTLLHACALKKSFSEGQSLHHHFLSLNLKPSLFITNHLINFYSKCRQLDYAQYIFDEMPERNLISWTALISGYYQHNQPEKCFKLFSCMLCHHLPNEFTFASVLGSCDRHRGQQVHGLAVKTSLDEHVYVGNSLITMYCKNDAVDHTGDGWLVFKNLPVRNLIKMHRTGVGLDRVTLLGVTASISCSGYIGENGVLLGLEKCCQLHCLVVTALVKAYSELGAGIDDCYKLFSEINGNHDIVSWTGIITIVADRDPKQALLLFCQLRRECLDLDRYTYSIVIKACAGFASARHCSAIHSLVLKCGFNGDLVLSNALIHAYARSGSITLSEQAYAIHGQGREALKLFASMNIKPDPATIVAVLTACSHAGLVDQGTEIFETMFEKYGISPQNDHFACMVDILGRAGRIHEAEAFINRMPVKPDPVVWSALLGGCRKHGEMKIAETASMQLMEMKLEPKNSLGYIIMSNIYSSNGRFKDAALIRKEMKGFKVRKEPGLSWIEVGNEVHEFAAGGQFHPLKDAIYAELEGLIRNLKEIGYVPEISFALQDMEEEHKQEQLYYHSEKMALAFALINGGNSCYRGPIIRMMKNIRICVDCHNFMKLASDLVQREIVVRDSNRFHHFRNGVCSCSDYW
ncbi:hypothetical protein MKX03_010138 [Papaver bracteatum]|nr:hypothetical protein MKX03_010138 [Papaver bracteatum]